MSSVYSKNKKELSGVKVISSANVWKKKNWQQNQIKSLSMKNIRYY